MKRIAFLFLLPLLASCHGCSLLGGTSTLPVATQLDVSFAGLTAKSTATPPDQLAAALLKTNSWVCNDLKQGQLVVEIAALIPYPAIQSAIQVGGPFVIAAVTNFCVNEGYLPSAAVVPPAVTVVPKAPVAPAPAKTA